MTPLPFDPKLPRREAQRLAALVDEIDSVDLEGTRDAVASHLQQLVVAARSNEFLDLVLAMNVATSLHALLDLAPALESDHQTLIVAAARYFALRTDADDDYNSPIGLEDDARVLNAVATAVGRRDLVIAIAS